MRNAEISIGETAIDMASYPEGTIVHAIWHDDNPDQHTLCGVIAWGDMLVREVVPSGSRLCRNCTRILMRDHSGQPFTNLWLEMIGEG